ncbi:MAG TPA: sugar phosphate isomerase/epimerase [Solirubrobacterales bacterium]|jgi:sugar phosphate isomerase/epimerase|nr:sugar phosphate isomerase/epimerase [Solirubrobacterales bacterium]
MRDPLDGRLGLNVPYEWWPAPELLAEIEEAGFSWVQLPAPPPSVLADTRCCIRHAQAVCAAVSATRLRTVLHAPGDLLAGSPEADRAIAGAISYAAECGAEQVVYHAQMVIEGRAAQDRLLAEARSLATLAGTAERVGVKLALENLAPVYPGPETVSANPLAVRSLARRLESPAVALCVDIGHANVVAGLRRTSLHRMIAPVLDLASVFHVHDNLGARWRAADQRPGIDPLRLDLHLEPGRGSIDWFAVGALLADHRAPLLLEIHPPRARPAELAASARDELGVAAAAMSA